MYTHMNTTTTTTTTTTTITNNNNHHEVLRALKRTTVPFQLYSACICRLAKFC